MKRRSISETKNGLSRAAEGWSEIAPSRSVRDLAERMLRVHPLREADALQLAAAIVGSEGRPSR